ncbi:MAG TPA: DinB family protein [Aggregatilineaceae bacterium]|nr:DinB family protein [Aggregatilineaceae bacterium]
MMDIDKQKAHLITRLENARAETLVVLKKVRPETVVYAESGWTVNDLVGHMADWELEVMKSIDAFRAGKSYRLSGYATDEAFNAQAIQKRREQPYEQLVAEWQTVREQLKAAVQDWPPEQFEERFVFPWGAIGTLTMVVKDMAEHEREHADAMRVYWAD